MQRPLKADQDGFWSHADRRGLFLFPARRLPGRNPPPVDDIRLTLTRFAAPKPSRFQRDSVCAAERRPRFDTSPILAEIRKDSERFCKLTISKPSGFPGGFFVCAGGKPVENITIFSSLYSRNTESYNSVTNCIFGEKHLAFFAKV
ncbi:MAG: hypothetical protein HFF88_04515 [Oscillibacter sp.]|nr:hypothetical protein [Oscillibacter sp.]